MNKTILFTILAAFTLLVATAGTNTFAQNVTQSANQTGEGAQAAMNETGEAAGNATEGLGVAMNETGEALSNVSESVTEGLQDVMNGSSQ